MKKPKAKTTMICVALFSIFLIYHFPYSNLRGYVFGKIHANTGILVTAKQMRPAFLGWPGIAIYEVRAAVPVGRGEINLASEKMITRIGLAGLFPPGPSFSLDLSNLQNGGDLYLKIKKKQSEMGLYLDAFEVNLAQFQPSHWPEIAQGLLTAYADLTVNSANLTQSNGKVELKLEDFLIASQNLQGYVLPSLNMGNVTGEIQIENGLGRIVRFQFGGNKADITGTLEGSLKMGKNWMTSQLDLTLRCQITEHYRKKPQSESLISFLSGYRLPGNDQNPDYAMQWSARIGEFQTNPLKAIPQRVMN